MTTFLKIRAGAGGTNSGHVATAHIAAAFFTAGGDGDHDGTPDSFICYLRLRDGSTLRDLTTDTREKALGRVNVIKNAIVAGEGPISVVQ